MLTGAIAGDVLLKGFVMTLAACTSAGGGNVHHTGFSTTGDFRSTLSAYFYVYIYVCVRVCVCVCVCLQVP
jgi:hypothetical protein